MAGPADVLIQDAFRLTKSSAERFNAMISSLIALNNSGIEGDIVECGVWHGGNIIISRAYCPERTCWLYDTFDGMPRPDPEIDVKLTGDKMRAVDRYDAKAINGSKWAAVSLEDVKNNFSQLGVLDDDRLRFVKGMVEDTLLDPDNVPDKIALLRLDTDWYSSTKVELEVLYPRLVGNGILIVDDYGHWAGCKKAVDDFFAGKPVGEIYRIDYTAIMMVKPC